MIDNTTCNICTISSIISYDEKVPVVDYHTPCCNRAICNTCTTLNPRFKTYCPWCQIRPTISSSSPTISSSNTDLSSPPSYESSVPSDKPPPYSTLETSTILFDEKKFEAEEEAIHYLRPHETIQSLSLAYNIPAETIRLHNRIFNDRFLAGRQMVAIPQRRESLSSRPMESDETINQRRKVVAVLKAITKRDKGTESVRVRDAGEMGPEVAKIYLQQNDWNVEQAIEVWKSDDTWEARNPSQLINRRVGK